MESSIAIKPYLSKTQSVLSPHLLGTQALTGPFLFPSSVMKVLVRWMNSAVIFVKGINSQWGRFNLSV